jgi:predicted GNAT superfamily acetyltransferase
MYEIVDFQPVHLDRLVDLNNAAVPKVDTVTAESLLHRVRNARLARVACDGDEVLGMVLCFLPGADYGSLNYGWFCENYDDFLYIDRIFVAEQARGQGIGEAFYRDIEVLSPSITIRLACEVNELPPNPGSLRFHKRIGFSEAGKRDYDGGAKRVVFLTKELPPAA